MILGGLLVALSQKHPHRQRHRHVRSYYRILPPRWPDWSSDIRRTGAEVRRKWQEHPLAKAERQQSLAALGRPGAVAFGELVDELDNLAAGRGDLSTLKRRGVTYLVSATEVSRRHVFVFFRMPSVDGGSLYVAHYVVCNPPPPESAWGLANSRIGQ